MAGTLGRLAESMATNVIEACNGFQERQIQKEKKKKKKKRKRDLETVYTLHSVVKGAVITMLSSPAVHWMLSIIHSTRNYSAEVLAGGTSGSRSVGY